jgi:hypothetical protein
LLINNLTSKVNKMNTQNNDLTLAIIAALVSAKPALKVDESLTTALQTAIDKALPACELSESVRNDFSRACSAKGLLHDTFKNGLVHVPDSQLQSKTGSHATLVSAHDVMLDLSVTVDTVYRLATQVINLTTRLTPSECNNELHNPAVGLIALNTVLGKVTATVSNPATASKDYPSLAGKMGLSAFTVCTHAGYGVEGYDQHREDNSAISIYIKVAHADELEQLMTAKKGGTFTFASNSLKYDVVPSNIVEGRQVVAIKYRFTLTKA